MKNETFYDIHCHAMNLSHPNLLAFLGRLKVEHRGLRDAVVGPYSSFFFGRPFVRMKNLLSVIENDLGSFFMLIEDDLAGKYLKDGRTPLLQNRQITVGGRSYGRIVITPLIMDFEYRNMSDGEIYYNRPPSKPINEQIVDIASGIRQYRRQRPEGMLEIYPFLGVNTRNYNLKQLENLLQKYFGLYRPMSTMFKNAFIGLPSINVSLQVLGNYLFSGVKLYPPLGFDPWPEDDRAELEKVRFLYDFCEKKQIPITTHCSESGFTVIDEKTAMRYASPARWIPVLKEYPTLKVNFAHMGRQYRRKWLFFQRTEWQRQILSLMAEYPNVYTDFSFIGVEPDFYRSLAELIAQYAPVQAESLRDRILFGSDFMINLIEIDSYFDYIDRYSRSELSGEQKHAFCSANPERFLFS